MLLSCRIMYSLFMSIQYLQYLILSPIYSLRCVTLFVEMPFLCGKLDKHPAILCLLLV